MEIKMQAGKRYIQEIFNRNWDLTIPFFQRSYVWGEEQWERFLTDMYDICHYEQEYFLGAVILKKRSEEHQHKMVVDGQQRLTTLVLFFKVLLLKMDKSTEFDVVFKKMEDGKSILKHNKNDTKSFEMILNLGLLQNIDNPINNIEKCYNYFFNNIKENELSFGKLLKYIAFVGVDLEPYENEQQIFDTINSLGVRLSGTELIKNYLFKNDEIQLFNSYWQSIFEKDKESVEYWHTSANKKEGKTLIDMLLFSFLQIKAKELGFKDKGLGQITNLLKSYRKLIPQINDKEVFLQDLQKYARIFRKHINPDIDSERLQTQMDRINLIIFEGGLFSIIPYVIFVLVNYEYAPEQADETLFVLESYLLRRMLGIDKGTLIAKDYADLFGTRLIGGDIFSANALKNHLKDYKDTHLHYVPTDNEIKLLLKNKTQTQAKAKLVLYLLDTKIRQMRGLETLYEFNKYYVDYLMPIKWQKSWQIPINEEARKIAIRTLGNTTLTPQKLNAQLKEAGWQERVNGKGKAKGLKDYNHLALVKPLLALPKWTDDKISDNNERLAEQIIKVWHL